MPKATLAEQLFNRVYDAGYGAAMTSVYTWAGEMSFVLDIDCGFAASIEEAEG